METMNDTIYPGQEFFRIIHEGERAGLYRVEVLATGKEEATLLGGAPHSEGGGRCSRGRQGAGYGVAGPQRHTAHTHLAGKDAWRTADQAHRQADGSRRVAVLPAGERIHIDVLPLPGGGMEHGTGGGRPCVKACSTRCLPPFMTGGGTFKKPHVHGRGSSRHKGIHGRYCTS